ncbi:fimbrillin family protein, partial [Phocaeicola sp.]
LSFRAYYPVRGQTSYSYFEVPTMQNTLSRLRKADYMLAEATDRPAGADAVPLIFKHQMARVTVILTPGDEAEGETFQFVTIGVNGRTIENGITTGEILGIESYKKDENTFIAILPPQEPSPNSQFIVVNSSSTYLLYGIPRLEKGKSYTLNLQVGHDGLKLGGITVEEWNTQDMDQGEAVDPTVWDGISYTQPADYDANNPGTVTINTAAELAWLAQQSNNSTGYTFELNADIDLNNQEWIPIGRSGGAFMGTFDGQGHTVSNMLCTTSQYAGLFGRINGATVQNVTVSGNVSYDAKPTYPGNQGGITGYALNSTITGCTNKCTVTAMGEYTQSYAGGIAGYVFSDSEGNTSRLTGNTNLGNVSNEGYWKSCVGSIIGCADAAANSSIILTDNDYSNGNPSGVCIGYCRISYSNGSITINETPATNEQPYPVPSQP